ncbi:MAG TPA: VWA domain-containing protein [Gaiellaceae bacterium]|jgi:Ca-activated chloride channel family protein|nr:VWA domain-containing protein [Gaiellaceae bacterium]
MSFGSPLALLALLAIPGLLGFVAFARRRARRGQIAYTNIPVLERVLAETRAPARRYVPIALLVLALAMAAAATAHPRARIRVRVNNATVVLLVDVSGSMSARDVEPTRLDAAVSAMRGFVERLPAGFEVGLVDFSDSPVVVTPPTADHEQVSQALDLLTPTAGTAIGDGLLSAIRVVRTSMALAHVVRVPGHRLPAAIVLLSDGNQTQGFEEPTTAAQVAQQAGIAVDTVALGTSHGVLGYGPFARRVAPDPALMQQIAKVTGGRTATATNATELASFYRTIGSSFGSATETRDVASWFAAAAALLLLGALTFGRLWAPSLG